MKKGAFILHSYMIENKQLTFIGRVAIDIKIGDILFYKNETKQESYLITNIIAYQHELDEISAGMTCKLIVQGNPLVLKENNVVLYIK